MEGVDVGWIIEYVLEMLLCLLFVGLYARQFWVWRSRRKKSGPGTQLVGPCQTLFFWAGFLIVILNVAKAVDSCGFLGLYSNRTLLIINANISTLFFLCGAGLIYFTTAYYTSLLQKLQPAIVRYSCLVFSIINLIGGNILFLTPDFDSPGVLGEYLLWMAFCYVFLAICLTWSIGLLRREIRSYTSMFGTGPLTSLNDHPETLHESLLAEDFDAINGSGSGTQRLISNDPMSVSRATSARPDSPEDRGHGPSADDTYLRLKGLLDSLFRLQVFLTIIIIAAVILFTLNGLANLEYLGVWPDPGSNLDVEQYQLVFGLSNWIYWLSLALLVWYSWYSDSETPPNSKVFSRGALKGENLASIPIAAVSTGSMASPAMPSPSPSIATTYGGSIPPQLSLDQATPERNTELLDSDSQGLRRSIRTTSAGGRSLGSGEPFSGRSDIASPQIGHMSFTERQNSAKQRAQQVAYDLAHDLGLNQTPEGWKHGQGQRGGPHGGGYHGDVQHGDDDDDVAIPLDEDEILPELTLQVAAPPPRVSRVDYEDDRFG